MSSFAEFPVRRLARRGFVLLEAVLALAIIGLVAIAVLTATSTQLRTAGKASELLVQKGLAEDRLSALRLLDYEGLENPPDSLVEGTFPHPFRDYRWSSRVELMEDEYDLFGVEITVSGPLESYPLRTLLHRPRPVLGAGGQGGGGQGGGAGGRGGAGGGEVGRGGGGNPGGGTGRGGGRGGGLTIGGGR